MEAEQGYVTWHTSACANLLLPPGYPDAVCGQVSLAGPDGALRLRPADDPGAWCHVTRDPRKAVKPTHYVRCGGRSSEEAQAFIVEGSGGTRQFAFQCTVLQQVDALHMLAS